MHLKPLTLAAALFWCALPSPTGWAASYSSTVAGLNPLVYYRLNDTPAVPSEIPAVNAGSLGPAYNGDYQSMAASRGQAGAIVGDTDTAVTIQGSVGQQVVVPFSADYNPNGPFTVEFWAKPTAAAASGGNHTAVISMINGQNPANGDDRSGWCVRHVGGDWQFILGYDHSDGATYYGTMLTAGGSVVADAWQHVVAVYTPTAAIIYVNGAQVATTPPAFPMLPNFAAPLILGDRGYTGWDFDGQLDEVAVYAAALTPAEIQEHYSNGLNPSRPKAYPVLIQEKSPAIYLRLGEPSLELPIAKNAGSLGAAADGKYLTGTTSGADALRNPNAIGFEATNTAAGFNGSSGSVQIPGFDLYSANVTMVCWLKRDGVQPARAGIMHHRKVTAPEVKATGLGFQDDGLALSYNWEDLGDAYTFNPGFVPPDQAWTFFAVTIAPDEQVMYMGTANGLVSATKTLAVSEHNFLGTTLELGWDNYQATRVFRGSLDEFAMFDKTLSSNEVASLFNAALPAILSLTRAPADPVYEGMDVTFTAAVAGSAPITYQWRKDGVNLDGQTAATLTVSNLGTADSGDYDVVVTASGQTLTSASSHLDVLTSPPVLVTVPTPALRFINGTVRFAVDVRGSQPMSYQWKHGTEVIPGATSATLVLPDLQLVDAGDYTVVVTNPYGSQEASTSLIVMTPSKYTAAIVDAGPVGHWRLDETAGTTAYDYWGGHDGTPTAGVTPDVAGPRPTAFKGFEAGNTAYQFAGNASAVVIPALNLNKNTVTIVAWIKPTGDQPDYAGIVFARGNTATGLDYTTEDQLGYHWNDDSATYNWRSGLYPVADQWNFVALVVEPTLGTIYLDDGVNGLLSSENYVNHGPATFADPLRIGVDSPGGGRGFVGTVDEVTVYDRALSYEEITALRNAGSAGTYNPTPVQITSQPKSQTILVGSTYTLEAKVTGSVPITYQWKRDGQDLPGATRSSLTFSPAAESDSGTYQLFVTQGTTQISSAAATLVVKPEPAYLNIPENLVLHLKFDGNYQDASGRNNNGTAVGSPQIVAGQVGTGALRYNTEVEGGAVTVANYVTLGTPTDLNFGGATSFSVAFWTRFSGSPGDLPFLCNNDNSYGDQGFTFAPSWETGSWSWSLNDGAAPIGWPGYAAQYGNDAGYADAINDGQWHHLVFLVDRAGDVTTYMDGVRVHAKSIAGLVFNLDSGMSVDIGQAGGSYAVAGTMDMDDLGIWRRVLTEYEAQSIYLVGSKYGRSFDSIGPVEVRVEIQSTAGGVRLTWTSGTLQSSDNVAGGYTTVAGATSPYVVQPGATGSKFYRVLVE